MHPRFLPLLCCPDTGESFSLEALVTLENGMVNAGNLRTDSGRSYPIVRGVPRFVRRQDYSASFGWEWTRWPRVQFESENVGRPMAGHTTRMWDRITGTAADDVRGRTIVDFGCGPGRFLDVVRRRGGVAVGIDLSDAVDAARTNFADDPDVLIVQADLLRPPFREGAFDGGFSIGVLHHTPDPQQGVRALARIVRPGGWVACCVYPKDDFYDYASVRRFRKMHHALRNTFGYLPALIYACIASYCLAPLFRFLKNSGLRRAINHIEQNWLVCLWLKDPRWRVLDVFDAITPHNATTHTQEEVADWLTAAGCESVVRTPWCSTSATSLRGPVPLIGVLPLPPGEASELSPSPLYPGERAGVRGRIGSLDRNDGSSTSSSRAPHPLPLPWVQGRGGKASAVNDVGSSAQHEKGPEKAAA